MRLAAGLRQKVGPFRLRDQEHAVMTISALLALVGALGTTPSVADPPLPPTPSACLAETEQARRIAIRFASSEEYADARQRHGVSSASPEQVRLLAGSADADLCARLLAIYRQQLAGRSSTLLPTFYQAGDFYYVALARRQEPRVIPPGFAHIDTRWLPLLILDRDLRLVASVAM
jgi:hypothetical protein